MNLVEKTLNSSWKHGFGFRIHDFFTRFIEFNTYFELTSGRFPDVRVVKEYTLNDQGMITIKSPLDFSNEINESRWMLDQEASHTQNPKIFDLVQKRTNLEVSWNGGTPSYHPFSWDFPL